MWYWDVRGGTEVVLLPFPGGVPRVAPASASVSSSGLDNRDFYGL